MSHRPDRETLLTLCSALLDGELAPADEAVLEQALAEDPTLVAELEAMAAAAAAVQRSVGDHAGFHPADASAAILAATVGVGPGASMAADVSTAADVALLASLAHDGELSEAAHAALTAALPQHAPAALSMLQTSSAAQEALRRPALSAAAHATAAAHIAAAVDARELLGLWASAALDGALAPADETALLARLPEELDTIALVLSAAATREALVAQAESAPFLHAAARAGAAALHTVQSEQVRAAGERTSAAARPAAPAGGLWHTLSGAVGGLFAGRMPGMLAGAAAVAAVFVLVGRPGAPADTRLADAQARMVAQQQTTDALVAAMTPVLLARTDVVDRAELPLLQDNGADVEAIDGADTTVVFATPASNITVIWIESTDAPDSQGT